MIELTERFYRNKKRSKSHLDLPLKRESGGNHKVTGAHCSRSLFIIITYSRTDAQDLESLDVETNGSMTGNFSILLVKNKLSGCSPIKCMGILIS